MKEQFKLNLEGGGPGKATPEATPAQDYDHPEAGLGELSYDEMKEEVVRLEKRRVIIQGSDPEERRWIDDRLAAITNRLQS